MKEVIIIKNRIKCLKCGDIIESNSVHYFVTCSCGMCFLKEWERADLPFP